MNRTLVLFLSGLITSVTMADEVDIPNQFQANTPAVAAAVNANFDAVEAAVDDNAQRVAALEGAFGVAGVSVAIDGIVVGRYIQPGHGFVDVTDVNGGVEKVAEAIGIVNSPRIFAVSSTGYFIDLVTSSVDHGFLSEGNLDTGPRYFETSDCTGNAYRVVQGDTGFFSLFRPGEGQIQPIRPWFARQGWVFASVDPNDPTPAYMVRRGAAVQTVALGSFLVYAAGLGAPFCVDISNRQGYDINDPLHVNHTVVPVEVNDPAETGISGILGGEITIGL